MIYVLLMSLSIFLFNSADAKSWQEIMNEYKIFGDKTCSIIEDQYFAFINGNAPTIANPIIKNIPINEINEELIDIRYTNNPRITMLPDDPQKKEFSGPFYNSGLQNASKIRKSVYLKLEKMLLYLDEISELFGYKKGSISIKVYEGLRDLATQEKLFQNKFNEIKINNPLLTNEEIENESAKWVSPTKNNVPVHSTGAAIDIQLWNEETNDFIDLGKFGVIWGENKSAPTFSENITDLQKQNRLYLLVAATKAGLVNYVYEFWHISAGDRYAIYWQEEDFNKRFAIYGALNI